MKRYIFFSFLILFYIVSCTSMEDLVKDTTSNMVKDTVSSTTSTSGADFQKVDFKEGEILAAPSGSNRVEADYLVAKVLTKPSGSSKNQGEFLFIGNGEKAWTPYFFETRIPNKNELQLGMQVFYCGWGRSGSKDLTSDSYRESWWYVGRITDLDELFKDIVIIDGQTFQLAAVRLPVPLWE